MQNNIQKIFLQALQEHKKGRLKNAVNLYRKILAYQPHHPDVNHNLGVLCVAEENFLVAIQLFKKSIKANPRYEQFWHSYIYTLIKSGQIEEAKKSFQEADKEGISSERLKLLKKKIIITNENDSLKSNSVKNFIIDTKPSQSEIDALNKSFQKKEFNNTKKLARAIICKCPIHPYAWKILAETYEQLGQFEESILIFEKVVSSSPDDVLVYEKLGSLLLGQGRIKEALENFKKMISIKPDNSSAYNNIGISLNALGQLEESVEYFRKATELDPENIKVLNNLGNAFKELGRFEESNLYFQKAVDVNPDYAEGYNNWGRALLLNYDFQKAF